MFDSVKKLADKDKVLSAASTAALERAMKQMTPRLQGVVHTPTQAALSAASEVVATYMSGEVLPTTYVIGDRGVGRGLLAKETTLVDSVLLHWPEYADFIYAGLVNGAEVNAREPTLTLDSLYMKNTVPTFVAKGSYIPVIFLLQSLEQFVYILILRSQHSGTNSAARRDSRPPPTAVAFKRRCWDVLCRAFCKVAPEIRNNGMSSWWTSCRGSPAGDHFVWLGTESVFVVADVQTR